jgi:hypothetical protein
MEIVLVAVDPHSGRVLHDTAGAPIIYPVDGTDLVERMARNTSYMIGLGPGYAWCCAFVYWCFDEAAKNAGRPNPMVRTAGCLDHWKRAPSHGGRRIMKDEAVDDPGLLQPGTVFIMDYGGGAGHTGFVERIDGGHMTTIEGNTDASGTREGGGVYRLKRKLVSVNKGFIDYSGA